MSQSLENVLIDPDDNAACHALHALLSTERFTKSPALPATAKAYLDAFCDETRPIIRRRWTGLILARLLESCLGVARHLRRHPEDLVRIGAVILGLNEAEETKIVAGLILRAGLSQGIKFSDFWSERKVHATATLFPKNADTSWMKSFQDYMDTLSGLSLGNSSPQLVLLYPVALHAADGFRWSAAIGNVPILLIESQTLTMITPASALHDIKFVYIPLQSVKNVRCQPSSPYDSQGGVAPAAPWAVVLEFLSGSTPYQVNCSEHSGRDFTIVMETSADAKECMRCINDMLRPEGSSSDVTNASSPAFDGDSSEEKVINNNTPAVSQGGIIKFDRSQRKGSIIKGSQLMDQAAPEAAHGSHTGSIEAKRGALPEVKKSLRASGVKSVLDATNTDFEFPDLSPSIERPAKAKIEKLNASRDGLVTAQISATKSTENKVKASKPVHKQAGRRRESDVFSVPQERQDMEGAHRGTKRTRAMAMTYKEDTSSEENSSDSEFTDSERTKRPRTRPVKATRKKERLASSPTKSNTTSRRPRQSKASTRPLQPLKGSLLSNLQRTTSANEGQNLKSYKTRSEARNAQKPTAAAPTKHKPEAASAPRQEDPSSEAHILGRLNDSESDGEPGDIDLHSSKIDDGVASRKWTSGSSTPSTPHSKRATPDHDGMETNAELGEVLSMSVKPPLTVAPARVLEDPSSPCDSRADRSMQAPPKPVVEEAIPITSPRATQRSVRSQRQFDERQTPIHQLGKRSHSGLSANLEILSSNSKPTPASPRAPSTAISGHADRHQVNLEQAHGEYKIEKSDPFQLNRRKVNSFTRRLTESRDVSLDAEPAEGKSQDHPIELGDSPSSSSSEALPPIQLSPVTTNDHTGITQPVELLQVRAPELTRRSRSRTVEPLTAIVPPADASRHQRGHQNHEGEDKARFDDDAEMEGDTLVEFEEPQQAQDEVSHLRSSPPPMDHSPSSHSSTSAEPEPKTDPHVPTSEAEEMEWEAHLRPHQRDVKDQLFRVSNRVLQHIVSNESAVSDIADTYTRDGQQSLDLLFESHQQEFDAMHKDVMQKKAKLSKATEKVLSKLRKERKQVEDDDE
ncbi:uncharacterized protein N0V89_012264 [Didymosphaeria variabile]|uniref:Uncharacterized protein n=1 Tax=Didymosphaeria variabile TaxID=1932322 RepID=A0A9W9C586_9PLEO|nr:uncharacterized protein N0V89_012264 [Didymosphaeria variabile]KAJ4344521.1 hypothetical protein N0V89_012264 [Didymosphaeria variabile]